MLFNANEPWCLASIWSVVLKSHRVHQKGRKARGVKRKEWAMTNIHARAEIVQRATKALEASLEDRIAAWQAKADKVFAIRAAEALRAS